MQKWEYCQLKGIWANKYSYPRLVFFTAKGVWEENLSGKDETARVDKRIAELGADGWEMVGAAMENQYSHSLYFKRPVNSN